MSDEAVIKAVEGGVARFTINAPEAGNAITPDMRDRLSELFEEASFDLAVRVIVLTGAGERHFCTGAQLGSRGASFGGGDRPEGAPERVMGDAARVIRRGWQRLIAAILDCEKPVVAAVNGTAAGGGAHLALACDFLVMAERARLIEVFVRRGLIPDAAGAYLLPRRLGLQRAKQLMFLGDDLSAADAEQWGLAYRVVPAEGLAEAVDELAGRLAAAPTRALAMTKWLVNRSLEVDRTTAFHDEAWAVELMTGTADSDEGVQSFLERRPPDFKGW